MNNILFKGTLHSDRNQSYSGSANLYLPFYPQSDGDFTAQLDLNKNNGQSISLEFKGWFQDECYNLIPNNAEGNDTIMMIILKYNPADDNWKGSYKSFYPNDFGTIIVECTVKCPGCLDDQPNQLAHIGPCGCLGRSY